MKMKRRFGVVPVLLFAVLGSLWAGGQKAASSGGIQLTIWQLNNKQTALDVITKEFNAANPGITVTAAYYDTDGIKDASKVAASSKTLPDMWFNWGGSLGGFYAENGLTYDLTAYAAANNWKNTFSPGALNLCTLSGKLSGYPISYNVLDVYYRKDIFEKYNLKVPTTFEEFEQVCATLKQNGITPISTAGLYGWHVMRFVELLIEHYAGAELHDRLNTFQTSFNNNAVIQALTKYKEFCDKGYFPTGFVTADPNNTHMEVFSGRAAMDIQGQWYDGNIIREKQDMSKFGTFAFPSGGTNRLSAFAEMIQLNASLSPEKLDACIKFLDFYFSKNSITRFGEYFNLPLPRLDSEMPADQPNVAVMLAASNKNGTFTITDQAFPTEIADELFRVQDGIANNQITPRDGAARIQAAIEAYQKK
ncbi:MAG: extracellular solute-binding protein [Spirochaetaceae bacterium]|jgi:raffinose/stachyose/melibiose transport system substrate-binding protein|nr:extracellular solute-binding protein [Spirochaetaceae bacterium]